MAPTNVMDIVEIDHIFTNEVMLMNTMQLLQLSIQAATLRQSVYANNIANAQTPGYKRQDVSFESILQSQLKNTSSSELGERHISLSGAASPNALNSVTNVEPVVYTDGSTQVDNNGNNVDLTNEMSLLAENQVRYDTLVQDVTDRIDQTRTAIMGS